MPALVGVTNMEPTDHSKFKTLHYFPLQSPITEAVVVRMPSSVNFASICGYSRFTGSAYSSVIQTFLCLLTICSLSSLPYSSKNNLFPSFDV